MIDAKRRKQTHAYLYISNSRVFQFYKERVN